MGAVLFAADADAQAAEQIGGRPPSDVETDLCSIASVFNQLQVIQTNEDCMLGCANGQCPENWIPGAADVCNAACGAVFEPFWDQCGAMLTNANMGGMDTMGVFYNHCLESLYPPGSCGTFCNAHTYVRPSATFTQHS